MGGDIWKGQRCATSKVISSYSIRLVIQTQQLAAFDCHHLTARCHLATTVRCCRRKSQLGKARVTPVYTVFWSYRSLGSAGRTVCMPCNALHAIWNQTGKRRLLQCRPVWHSSGRNSKSKTKHPFSAALRISRLRCSSLGSFAADY